jgi:dipeptidyl aminopeptidase/acylaminoacyl peptidase
VRHGQVFLKTPGRATKVDSLMGLRSVPKGSDSGEGSAQQMSSRLAKENPTDDVAGDQYSTNRVKTGLILSLTLTIFSSLSPSVTQGQAARSMTVRDSIEKATFIRDAYNGSELANFSPDGRYFFVMTERGVLQSNRVETTIWLFDTASVSNSLKHPLTERSPDPRALVKMGTLSNMMTLSNGDAITEARWTPNSESIAFLGRDNNFERHLFTVTIKDGQVKQLTPNGQDLTGFDSAKGSFVLMAVPSPTTDSQLYQSGGATVPDIQIGTGMSLFSLLYPQWEKFVFELRAQQVWRVRDGKASPVVEPTTSLPVSLIFNPYASALSLSPSGRYAVVADFAAHVPATWESYETRNRFANIVADKPNTKPTMDPSRPLQYELIDLQNGTMSKLINAPTGWSASFPDALKALWSQNEQEVILTNTFLPLEGDSSAGLPHSLRPWVVAVDIESRKIVCIKEASLDGNEHSGSRLSNLEWQAAGQRLVLRYFDDRAQAPLEPELFQKVNGTWKAITNHAAISSAAGTSRARRLSILVREGVNQPPVLMATDLETGESRQIWDPNPQFAGIKFGEATVYKWHDKGGHEWIGGLVKPPDYVARHRYPLVIQTHGFNQTEFLTDGSFPTAMAARPIAARGIIVLQIEEISISPVDSMTPREVAQMRDGYLAAIEHLDADELIDPQRVGIIGLSHTGWYVLNSLVHAGKHFAAATLANCTYISFGEYLLNADYGGAGRAKAIAGAIGSEPFGEGLRKWISDSSGFNTDKIGVPILFEANSPVEMIYAWDIYAAMRLQKKPVELLYFRNGSHILAKPLERLASQEMSVDWYDFWLNDHEDQNSTKIEQYARWEKLKKLQEKNQEDFSRSESQ